MVYGQPPRVYKEGLTDSLYGFCKRVYGQPPRDFAKGLRTAQGLQRVYRQPPRGYKTAS